MTEPIKPPYRFCPKCRAGLRSNLDACRECGADYVYPEDIESVAAAPANGLRGVLITYPEQVPEDYTPDRLKEDAEILEVPIVGIGSTYGGGQRILIFWNSAIISPQEIDEYEMPSDFEMLPPGAEIPAGKWRAEFSERMVRAAAREERKKAKGPVA